MKFSIARLIVAITLANVVFGLTFAAPAEIGIPILTFISLVILPPALIVGAVNTRGVRQAFFLGCMFAGIAHFILSTYIAIFFSFSPSTFVTDLVEENSVLRYIHLIGYMLGLTGGLSGVGMYYLIAHENKKLDQKKSDQANQIDDPFAPEADRALALAEDDERLSKPTVPR
ncbi:MAG: hypothetical protein AAFN77_05245 [Planctomycetota bacterium]